MTFHLCYNKNKVLYLTMTKDYKNFSKVADLAVERVAWTTAESPKFFETETMNRIREKKMVYTHFKTWLCFKSSVREKKTFNRWNDAGGRN